MDKIFKPFSGEGAYFKHDLLPHISALLFKGYSMELYLNYQFCKKHVKLLKLAGVHHMRKYDKQSHVVAIQGILQEIEDILKEIFRQKNPIDFFIYSYLYQFYIKLSQKK